MSFTKFLNDKSTKETIKSIKGKFFFVDGLTRVYKFNASSGIIEDDLTESKLLLDDYQYFTLISFRKFTGDLYREGKVRDFVEFFYLNELGQVCSTLIKTYSLTNFEKACEHAIFVNGVTTMDFVQIGIKASKKDGKDKEGKPTIFYELKFDIKPSGDEILSLMNELSDDPVFNNIYRLKTLQITESNIQLFRYPSEKAKEAMLLDAGAEDLEVND